VDPRRLTRTVPLRLAGWGVVVAALVIAPRAYTCSQCLCGTPFPADLLGGVVPLQLRYGFEERYLSKANALDESPGSEREREHRIAGFALWRPTNRIALLGRLPYNVKQITESPAGEVETTQRAQGLGDLELQVLVGLVQSPGPRPRFVGVVAGFEAPTGASDVSRGGERLDAHLQPGTGAWSGTGGIHAGLARRAGLLDASILGRANGTNAHGYHYGHVLLYNAGYTSPSRRGWELLAQLNGRTAARDRLEDGTLGENTGGTVVYAAPGARWRSGIGVTLEAAAQIPVLEELNGDQDEHATLRIALSVDR
jgi:hypothetical protein